MNDMLYIWVAVFAIIAHLLYTKHRNTIQTEKWVRLVLALGDLKIHCSKEAANMALATAHNDEQIFFIHYRQGGYVEKLPYYIAISTDVINTVESEYILLAVARFTQASNSGIVIYKLEPYTKQIIPELRGSGVTCA